MIKLSSALLLTLLLTIFFPFSLNMLMGTLISLIILLVLCAYLFTQFRVSILLIITGIILGSALSVPKLQRYQTTYYQLPQSAHYQFTLTKIFKNSQSIEAVIQNDPRLNHYAIRIYNVKAPDLHLNGIYQAELTIQPNHSKGNFYRFSQRLQHLANNRIGIANLKSPLTLIQKPSTITEIRVNTANHYQMANYNNADIMSALTVGLTDTIPPQTWDLFRQTGTIHLISISGLHLTFIALWCFIILRIIFGALMLQKPAPYQIASLLSLGIAVLYAVLAGMSLPTQRALIMFSLLMLALLMRYPILSLESLSTALLIILLISPFAVLTIGFWLSFASVLILILLSRYQFSLIPSLLLTQFIISMLAIPIVGSFFGEVSLISPITNLFAIPWMTIFILPFLLIGTVLLPILPALSERLFTFSDWSITQLLQFLRVMHQLPYSHSQVLYIPILAAIAMTFLAVLPLTKLKFRIKLFGSFGLMIMVAGTFKPNHDEYLLLLPVGEGLSALLKTNDTSLLFDTGRYYRGFDSGKSVIIPTLDNIGIQTPEYIVLSHNNQQHVGGTRSLRWRYPDVKMVVHSSLQESVDDSQNCNDFTLMTENLTIEPLKTNKSCAFQVTLKQQLIWLIADITPQEWQSLIRDNGKPDIVLFPNQGRSKGFVIPADWADVILLASTKNIHPSYQSGTIKNSYNGAIKIKITDQRAIVKLSNDATHFWWMNQVPPI